MRVVLETARPVPGESPRSLILEDPVSVLVAEAEGVTEWTRDGRHDRGPDPLVALRAWLGRWRSACESPSRAMAGGWLGYGLAELCEPIVLTSRDDEAFPRLALGMFTRVTHVDSDGRHREVRADELRARILDPRTTFGALAAAGPVPGRTFTRDEYERAVQRVRDRIRAGDVYQVNLAQRFAGRSDAPPAELYAKLRAASPAPFSALVELGDLAVVSASPEEFLRVRGGCVRTRPIKGTRPRASDAREDRRLADELVASEKDAAELVMIVDLLRNDLGRVCEPGSVVVPAPRVLEQHPTVWHASATIEGQLLAGRDVVDLLRASFPCGSVTGAPKIAAMRIIDELEPVRRGAFTGSVGWLGLEGDLHLSVSIRTIQVRGEHASFHAGGGIVWDSDPHAEYEETLAKGRALARALGFAVADARAGV
jgi:para-aminobenzoate synthetase component 1